MAPPDLAADAPVFNVVHPLEIGLLPILWNKFDLPCFDHINGRFSQWPRLHKPLVGEVRLDHGAGAVSTGHHQFVRFDLLQQAECIKVGDNRLACIIATHAAILLRHLVIDLGVDGEDVDQW